MYGSLLPESGRYASPEIVTSSCNVIKEYPPTIPSKTRDSPYPLRRQRSQRINGLKDGVDSSGPLHATDSWNFGTLIYEIFNGAFSNSDQLNNKGVIPQV